jgi:hypothetical protein
MRESFIVYQSFYGLIKLLKNKEKLRMYEAIFEYGFTGQEPQFDDITSSAIWQAILPQLKANNRRYENGCKGAEYGNLGGAKKGNQNAKKTTPKTTPNNAKKTTPKTTPNENDNENENVNDNINHFTLGAPARVYEESEIMTCADFLDRHKNVIVDTNLVYGLDWNLLDERFNESKKYLSQPHALSWIKNNYAKIIQGYYKDKTTVKSETKFDCMEFLDGITEQLKARGNET